MALPNGMVDRIARATGERERGIARDEFGVEDAGPVFCEDFIEWVVEDNFPAGRPAFEEVGAQFVADVTPFEHMKIRILNGGHALIAYPSGLLDIHFVHDGMADPLVRGFLQRVEQEEILPILPPVPDTDLDDYLALIVPTLRQSQDRRHHPPALPRRLEPAAEFMIPSIRTASRAGCRVRACALASALGAATARARPIWRVTSRTTRAGTGCKRRPAPRERTRWLARHAPTSTARPPTPGVPRRLRAASAPPLVQKGPPHAPPLHRMTPTRLRPARLADAAGGRGAAAPVHHGALRARPRRQPCLLDGWIADKTA